MQHRINVNILRIKKIDFGFLDGNTKKQKTINKNGRFMVIILDNGGEERVSLIGYSKRQIQEIELSLFKINPDIIFKHSSDILFNWWKKEK